jgi:hypothetical protein
MSKYNKFILEFLNYLRKQPEFIRTGQALINFLSMFDNEEYGRISSVHYYDKTDIDCFYVDSLIPNTLKHLQEVWKDQ